MPLTPEQREMLNQRREEVQRELETLSAAPAPAGQQDPTDRWQELQDELGEIQRDLGEIEPEE